MKLRSATPFLAVALLSACATTPDMKVLSPSARNDCFVITEPVSYYTVAGVVNRPIENGLFADTYRAVLEDANAVYYRGTGEGSWRRDASSKEALAKADVFRYPGGIMVPKSPGKRPFLFIHEDLTGRAKIPYETALQLHARAVKDGDAPPTASVPSIAVPGYQSTIGSSNSKAAVVPAAVGSAIAHSLIGVYLKANNGRILVHDKDGDNSAFWNKVESTRTSCK